MTIHDSPAGIADRQRVRSGLGGTTTATASRRQDECHDHRAKIEGGREGIRRHAAEQRSTVDALLEAAGQVLQVDLLRHPGARHLAAELVGVARAVRRVTNKAA